MLFLLFQIGRERYALETANILEVVPLLTVKQLPGAPPGVAGIINYRGRPVPVLDLSEVLAGRVAEARLSTRIVMVRMQDEHRGAQCLGLIVENATSVLRQRAESFVNPGVNLLAAPYLGPVLMDERGSIQWIHEQRLLPDAVKERLFSTDLKGVR